MILILLVVVSVGRYLIGFRLLEREAKSSLELLAFPDCVDLIVFNKHFLVMKLDRIVVEKEPTDTPVNRQNLYYLRVVLIESGQLYITTHPARQGEL